MSLTKHQFRELLRGSIKTRKSFERQVIAENLKKEGYEQLDEDDFTDAETADLDDSEGETVFQPKTLPEGDDYASKFARYADNDSIENREMRSKGADNYTVGPYDQKTLREPSKTDNPYGYNLISDWDPKNLAAKGREDALAAEQGALMNPLYALDAKYAGDSIEDRKFKQDKAAYYRDAYEKALAAKTTPMSRKGLDEGCGDVPMAEPEMAGMEDEDLSFTGDVGELSGDEAFAVGWTAALEQARSTIEGLLDNTGEESPPEEEIVIATEEY